jgi:hypothetical protein
VFMLAQSYWLFSKMGLTGDTDNAEKD